MNSQQLLQLWYDRETYELLEECRKLSQTNEERIFFANMIKQILEENNINW